MSTRISAFILAAGEGRRLRPATLSRAKALVPFCGVPLLELTAAALSSLPIDNMVVNCCYQADRVSEFCARLARRYNWDLQVSQEHQLLNHGGGLRKGYKLIPEAEHILVHNVDVIIDFDLEKLIDAHLQREAAVTVLLIPGKGPQSVSLDEEGNIINFRDPKNGTHTFSGIHIFRPDVLSLLPDDQVAPDIVTCYQKALQMGWPVQALCLGEEVFWSDIGNAQDYIRAHGEIADCALTAHPMLREAQSEQAQRRFALEQKGVQCSGALGLGCELGVPAGSQLHNVVLWDYTRLPRPLLYADGIFVGDDVPPPKPVGSKHEPDWRLLDSLDLKPGQYELEELPKQGSGRLYKRIKSADKSWVWCAYDPERRENAGFAAISEFLCSLNINVPRIIRHQPDCFEIIIEDLGQSDLQLAPGPLLKGYLFGVVEQIARLHVLGDQAVRLEELPLQKGFTKGLYDWERDYFRNNMLQACLRAPELWVDVAREYRGLRELLLRQPLVPIHRDLQSANIKLHNGKLSLIDFQGMRLGCAAYDLASLLYDPYQCHKRELRREVWREYQRQVKALGGDAPNDDVLYAAACQRLMQALGAYGKLLLQDKLEWYAQFIVPGLKMLKEAAQESGKYPNMQKMAEKAISIAQSYFDNTRKLAKKRTTRG
ncbi:MAG: NTP transferase domain-containing protein [Oligosphaeraceae bacterium]|nr:NTP transferase domain-containing protein [Oligosphaeraceae bacterium]